MDEYLLVEAAGFEPLGFVVGSSIYHIGYQQSSWKQSQEMVVLSQAMYAARELAMTRMEEEADQLGADGVVGVRLQIGRYDWGENMAEFIALGTAVKHSGGEVHRAPDGRPFTSDLSGQDFYKLITAGHRPLGLVMGSCVYHVAHQSMRQAFKQIGQNVEMPNFTQALYDARELAMERMQHEAAQAAGEGRRRRPPRGELARLGLARDRVLRRGHRDHVGCRRRRRDREADADPAGRRLRAPLALAAAACGRGARARPRSARRRSCRRSASSAAATSRSSGAGATTSTFAGIRRFLHGDLVMANLEGTLATGRLAEVRAVRQRRLLHVPRRPVVGEGAAAARASTS